MRGDRDTRIESNRGRAGPVDRGNELKRVRFSYPDVGRGIHAFPIPACPPRPATTNDPMPLRIYNTLTQTKEPFQTVTPGRVGIYVCGPTVYSPSHIGHMVGPVIFDTIKRYLLYLGYQVTWVVNITDVDDKLIVQAQKDGTTVQELAERVTGDYLHCLSELGVDGIDHLPRATEHIGEIITINRALIDKGFAYE